MHRILLGLLAVALSGCATVSDAGALADLAIVDRNTGHRLPTYYHQGRYWIAGTPGNKYSVAVSNKSGQRIMTVISVDGVNVVSGETATPGQNGYVLDRGMHYEINGWRKNTNEVAAFVFTVLPDSYAARTGRPDNVGVIGMAVFREWIPPRPALSPPYSHHPRRHSHAEALSDSKAQSGAGQSSRRDSSDNAAPSAAGEMAHAQREERLGTGHGERESSRVSYTHFRRASDQASELLTIYYDSYANLVSRGIIPSGSGPAPNPFPAGMRFVPDPRG